MQSRFISLALFCLLSSALLSPRLHAAAPPYLPIQGVLASTDGTPVDGEVNVEFAVYDSEVGVTPLWSETQRVLVEEGFFTAYLGEVTDMDLSMFRDNGDLWLGVTVGTDSEMPRVFLGSTPFSAYAEHCGSVPDHAHGYGDLTGSLPESALPSGTVLGEQGCTGTDKVVGIDLSGALVCATDEDTTYLAGTGLVLSAGAFSLDVTYTDALYVNEGQASSVTSAMITDGEVQSSDIANGTIVYDDVNVDSVQRRVTGTCAAGSAVSSIASNGSVGCEADDDTAAPGTTFEIGGGTAWVANRTTAFAGGWRRLDALVPASGYMLIAAARRRA